MPINDILLIVIKAEIFGILVLLWFTLDKDEKY